MKLLWLDLETTGLDPKEHAVLEVGAIVTDGLTELGRYHAVVSQPPEALARMNDFVRDMHTKNGLLDAMKSTATPWPTVAAQLRQFVVKHFAPSPVEQETSNSKPAEWRGRLAGYSAHFDKKWLEALAPEMHELLSHRVFDMSTIRDLYKALGVTVPITEAHRSIADCEHAFASFQAYLKLMRVGAAVLDVQAGWRLA